MSTKDIKLVLEWYKQYSHSAGHLDTKNDNNFFIKATSEDFCEHKRENYYNNLPQVYINFLIDVGYGRLREDANGRVTRSRDNVFLSPHEIREITNKDSPEWRVYEDLIDENEIPFFQVESNTFFVFSPEGEIYFPFKVEKYANNLDDFLKNLMNDVMFYSDKG